MMKIYKLLFIILLHFFVFTSYGQNQGESRIGQATYNADDKDFGSMTISYTYAFNGTQFKIKVNQVIIGISNAMLRNEPGLSNELRKRDILPHTQQDGKGIAVEYGGTVEFFNSGYPGKLPLTPSSINVTGSDYTFFEPTEALSEIARIYRNNNNGASFYNKHASLSGNISITSFDFPSLRQEVEAVRAELKRNRETKKQSEEQAAKSASATESATANQDMGAAEEEQVQEQEGEGNESEEGEASENSATSATSTTTTEQDVPSRESFDDIVRRVRAQDREIERKGEAGRAAVNATAGVMSGLAQEDGDNELVYQYLAPDNIALTVNDALFGFRSEGNLFSGLDFGVGQATFSTAQDGEVVDDSGFGFALSVPVGYRFRFSPDLKTSEGSGFLGIMGNGGMYFGSVLEPAGYYSFSGYAGVNFMHITFQAGYGTLYDLTGDLQNYELEGIANGGSSSMLFIRAGFTW